MKILDTAIAHYVVRYISELDKSGDFTKKRAALNLPDLPESPTRTGEVLDRWLKAYGTMPQPDEFSDNQVWMDALSKWFKLHFSNAFKVKLQNAYRQHKHKLAHSKKSINLSIQTHMMLQEAAADHGVNLDEVIFMALTGRLDHQVTEKLQKAFRRYRS